MIKAGIFDIGGVLHTRTNNKIYQDIMKTLQIDEETFKQTEHKLSPLLTEGKISEDEYWKQFLEKTHPKGSLPEKSLFLRQFAKKYQPYDDMLNLIQKLKKNLYKTAVVSDTIKTHTTFLRDQGMFDDFDVCIFSYNENTTKPDTKMYEDALEKLQILPNEAFFVDDIENNVQAANKLGIHGILFQGHDELLPSLTKLGVHVD